MMKMIKTSFLIEFQSYLKGKKMEQEGRKVNFVMKAPSFLIFFKSALCIQYFYLPLDQNTYDQI